MPQGSITPDWYQQKLEGLMARVENALAPMVEAGDEQALKRAARVLWAGVHGITSLSTADKLSNVTTEQAGPLVDDLVTTFLTGFRSRQSATCL